MNKKERRVTAGSVCQYISKEFRAIDAPNKQTILWLDTALRELGFELIDDSSGSSKAIACMAAKCIFSLEKLVCGYTVQDLPACILKHNKFINQYFNYRTRGMKRYTIKQGSIAVSRSIDTAIDGLSDKLSQNSTMAPC